MDWLPGSMFGQYRLEARLGSGTFGSVWRATDTKTATIVALKILAGSWSESESAQLRTDVELLAAAAAAGSTHVVKVLDGGPEPAPHVVMEYLEGSDLASVLDAEGKLPQQQVIDIGEAVADALSALARVGIVHRDVKPANIMLGPDGSVKLADFGIAKIVGFDTMTSTGQLPLTMAYAAPEVWDGKATGASDLYALGVVLYQCLTAQLPFVGSYHEVYQAHMSKAPDLDILPPETTPTLRSLIESCMAKETSARPADPATVLAALDEARGELEARQSAPGGHPPVAFGPWRMIAAHPTRAWAWGVQHEKTGERAIVEVCFSDSAALGESLHRAVEANSALVPLGAERLLGTNRLILRPNEAWPVPPPSGPYAFWVARKELPTPPPTTLGERELRRVIESVEALRTTATAAGIRLDLGCTALVALPDGTVHLRRPGLPPDTTTDPDAAALDSIRKLPMELALTATVARAPSFAALRGDLGIGVAHTTPTMVGVARPGAGAASAPTVALEQTDIRPIPALPSQDSVTAARASEHRRRRRVGVALLLVGLLVALMTAMAFAAFGAGGSHSSPTGSSQIAANGSSGDAGPGFSGGTAEPGSGSVMPGAGGNDLAGPSGSASGLQASSMPGMATPTTHGSGGLPPVGPTPTPVRTATPIPTPVPTPTPTPTPVPDPNPDLVVSTDPGQSTDGVAHGAGNPFVPTRTYHNVTIEAGAYVSRGGTTLVLNATGTVLVSGVITMDGHGYAGGGAGRYQQGSSPSGTGASSTDPNGGGGGACGSADCGGAGGGYGTAGSPGNVDTGNTVPQGGLVYGDSLLSTLYPGSGGGTSGNSQCDVGCTQMAGGAGGGIIVVTGSSITVTGRISANGLNGASAQQGSTGWRGGGGGSGGSILLQAATINAPANLVTATGGSGGYGNNNKVDVSGGHGGNGRIRYVH